MTEKTEKKTDNKPETEKLLLLPPEDLIVIDIPGHPLYDPTIHKPLKPMFVANIDDNGVMQAIEVRKNGKKADGTPRYEVVYGRTRTRAACAVNVKRLAEGRELLLVRVVITQGDDLKMMNRMNSENEARTRKDPITRAQNMAAMKEAGRTTKQLRRTFICSAKTIRSTLALLDLHPVVQDAVRTATISASLATDEFSELPREDQPKKLEELIASGHTKGMAGQAVMKNLKSKDKPASEESDETKEIPKRLRSRALLMKLVEALKKLKPNDDGAGVAMLKFVLGNDKAFRDRADYKLAATEAGWAPQ